MFQGQVTSIKTIIILLSLIIILRIVRWHDFCGRAPQKPYQRTICYALINLFLSRLLAPRALRAVRGA